jgi:hypothetical protein
MKEVGRAKLWENECAFPRKMGFVKWLHGLISPSQMMPASKQIFMSKETFGGRGSFFF